MLFLLLKLSSRRTCADADLLAVLAESSILTRVGLPSWGQTSITFEMSERGLHLHDAAGVGLGGLLVLGHDVDLGDQHARGVNSSPAMTLVHLAFLALVRPAMTTTLSFFLILNFMALNDLRRERDDLQKFLVAQFAGHGSEHAGALRLALSSIRQAALSSKPM